MSDNSDNWIAALKPGDTVAVCGTGTYTKVYLDKVNRVLKAHIVTDGDSKFSIDSGREAGSSRSWSWRYLSKPDDPVVVKRIQEQRLASAQRRASEMALRCDDLALLLEFAERMSAITRPNAEPAS